MASVVTKKGTTLPLMNLKGKDYLQVAHRIMWFREDHPMGIIRTEFLSIDEEQTVAKAHVFIKDDKGDYVSVSQGTKRESKKDFADHTEKAETGAIGRALALIGYGTQFAIELDEGTRIVDSPLPGKAAQVAAGTGTAANASVSTGKPASFRPVGANPQANAATNANGTSSTGGW